VADNEPVYAPDQLKPGKRRLGRVGAILTAVILLALVFPGQDTTGLEKVWLIGIAAGLVLVILGDGVLRRNGLR
jgi:hypothetical protein